MTRCRLTGQRRTRRPIRRRQRITTLSGRTRSPTAGTQRRLTAKRRPGRRDHLTSEPAPRCRPPRTTEQTGSSRPLVRDPAGSTAATRQPIAPIPAVVEINALPLASTATHNDDDGQASPAGVPGSTRPDRIHPRPAATDADPATSSTETIKHPITRHSGDFITPRNERTQQKFRHHRLDRPGTC